MSLIGPFDQKRDLENAYYNNEEGVGMAWAPWKDLVRKDDGALAKTFKGVELYWDWRLHGQDDYYPEPLIYTTLSEGDSKSLCFDQYGKANGRCVSCIDPKDKGKDCLAHNIRGQDAYIKTAGNRSVAAGFFLPVDFGRWSLRPGAITRLVVVEECAYGNGAGCEAARKLSVDAVVKLRYRFHQGPYTNVSAGLTGEKSISGIKTQAISGGIIVGW
jgi:hypothetical protein